MPKIPLMFLISDGPFTGGPQHYRNLTSIIQNALDKTPFELVLVSETVNEPKKPEIQKNMARVYSLIEDHHPQVIVAMGEAAFHILQLPDTRVSRICNIPQKLKVMGYDLRPRQVRVGYDSAVADTVIFKDGTAIKLPTHKDIWVYPTYKHETLLSYANGYKGQDLLKRQLVQIKSLLANPDFKQHDFTKLVKLYYKPEHEAEAIASLNKWIGCKKFAFDIETAGYDIPKDAQLNYRHYKAEISVIAIGDGQFADVYNTHHLPQLRAKINEVLAQPGKHFTWNGKFDREFLRFHWDTKFIDTHIDGRACLYLKDLNVQFLGKGTSTLKFTASTFLPDGIYFAGYQKNGGIDTAIQEGDGKYLADNEVEFMTYCGIDVVTTYRVTSDMWNTFDVKNKKLVTDYYEPLSEMLNEIHKDGIRVDTEKLEGYIEELTSYTEHIRGCILSEVDKLGVKLTDFNVNSGKQIARVMYDLLKLDPIYTDKGSLSVGEEALAAYKHITFCRLVSDYKGFLKQLEIFWAIKENTTGGKCFPVYNQYRTTSSRLSSQHPPIQIVPTNKKIVTDIDTSDIDDIERRILHRHIWKTYEQKKNPSGKLQLLEYSPNFKEIFLPDPGFTLLYADYCQLEIAILANYIAKFSSDKTLQDAIRAERDMHSYTASMLYSTLTGTAYTEEFIKANKDIDPYYTWRQDSKAVIFKLIYGGSYKSFARDKHIPKSDAKRIFDTFLNLIRGIADYMDHQKKMAQANLFTETYAGHRRDLSILGLERNNGKAKNISLNHPIQGTASYFVNQAMMEYHKRLKLLHPGARILLTVHDSIASQVPNDKVYEGLKLLKWCMVDYVMAAYPDFLTVPLRAEYYYGKNWHKPKKWNGEIVEPI